VQLVLTCLLYFTSFGAIFALFASVVSIVIWLLKTLLLWLIAEPETDTTRSTRFRPQELDHLKRAGQ
jgi:hypothetical protein